MSSLWTVHRSTSDAKVSGVCGGVARHWGVDPLLVRVGCALLALSGGIGVVLYLAGWLLLPKDGREEPVIFDLGGSQVRSWTREVWLVLVGICCLVSFALLAPLTPFGVGPAVILALVWYFGYYKHSAPRKAGLHGGGSHRTQPSAGLTGAPVLPTDPTPLHPTQEPQDTPFGQAAQAWRQRVAEVQAVAAESGPPQLSAPWSPAPAAPPVGSPARAVPLPSRVGRVTSRSARRLRLASLAVLAITLAGLGAADARGVTVPLAGYLSAALLVLGLTLVAAAWLGRARGILPLAVLVLVATVAATAVGPAARSLGWGSEQRTYTRVSDLSRGDVQERGRLQVDLRRLPMTSDATYTAHVGVGDLEVSLPADTNVVLRWKFRAGAVLVNDTMVRSGTDLHGTEPLPTRNPNGQTLVVDLSVDQGVVQVRR